MSLTRPRVVYYRIHDRTYPRNSRIRRYLADAGFEVVSPRPSRVRGRIVRLAHDVFRLWAEARRSQVVVLSELRLAHAPFVTLVGRLTRCTVVIDGFVGLHETAVGDWKAVSPTSFRARLLRLQDRLAVAWSDVYLIDTQVRAAAVRLDHPRARCVLALPVGAPPWAMPQPARTTSEPLRILYYGNYIPLHGLDIVIEALGSLAPRRAFSATFVGNGSLRPAIEARAVSLGIANDCVFLDSVPEEALLSVIASTDVVLGTFGTSAKAQSVVANKVWQGLACGRVVVTRDTAAVRELAPIARNLLVGVRSPESAELADTLAELSPADADTSIATDLEAWVAGEYAQFGDILRDLVESRCRR
ncbi:MULTISPECIES: glycosyltransferase [unclassified Frondihabitans]|uniref:glycosyltransferase n=1 Tax=unclassified Frondihabitans TaxID=2626248 RepID=UPI000F4F320E|nr:MULTISPECIES: glycosyltransferase [unclassified Frondihabitans]RPE78206.1 glycosyltransferase involved in cell wall biosynthesis [Frondihabitans sp. PhB153]RPF08487.1 glycosyltransferase involved in cell wall biosynthesis [Frondihabitans sp. PhB161]